jgi:hypothetical protein
VPPPEPEGHTEGTGTTDADGDFDVTLEDADGNVLGAIVMTGAGPGQTVTYELIEGDPDTGAPGEEGGTFAGFADGVALGRTLVVSSSATPGSYVVTLSLTFTAQELAAAGIEPADVEIHYLDPTQPPAPGQWVPAGGSDRGESAPTGIVGDSGYITDGDGSVTFWVIVDHLSVFAVGKPEKPVEPADGPDEPDDEPGDGSDSSSGDEPAPEDRDDPETQQPAGDTVGEDSTADGTDVSGFCGAGSATAVGLTIAGLFFLQRRRRQPGAASGSAP